MLTFVDCELFSDHAGLQYALPATWMGMAEHGLNLSRLASVWSEFPAQLAGVAHRKGRIAQQYDADLVVWQPEADAGIG